MKRIFVLCFLSTSFAIAHAQDSIQKENEVIVTAFRFKESLKKIPFTVKKITNKGWNMQAPTTADVLQNSAGVMVQKSQGGGGSPVIRGFEASRILLMVDGVRMNNAIYRSGHLQNIITVDANILQSVDILYGPASTQFGSDALGGVIHLNTKNPQLSTTDKKQISGSLNGRYSSALNENQTHFSINMGHKKWASLSSITLSRFSDLIQGNNRKSAYPDFGKRTFYVNTVNGVDYKIPNEKFNIQVGSGYDQIDALQKIKFIAKNNQEHLLNFQYSNSSDIPRYDRLSEITVSGIPRFAEWYYGPQKRAMASYQFHQTFENRFFKKIQSTIAYQDIEESRFDRRFNNRNRNSRIENIKVISGTLDALRKKDKMEIHTGIEFQLNRLQSNAYSENIVTGNQRNDITYRYPNGKNKMNTWATYLQSIYTLSNMTSLTGGVRYTLIDLYSSIINNNVFSFPFSEINQRNGAFSGNIGITHNTQNNIKLAALISTGFRAPNFDELKIFDNRAGFLIVPNENIQPEYTYNAEINASKFIGNFQMNASIFFTLFNNLIQVDDFTFNGNSTIVYQGSTARIQAAQNKSKANVYGASANLLYTIQNKTTFEGSITYTVGNIINDSKLPLDHIPPVYGKLGVKHTEKKWNAELFSLFNGWKRLAKYSNSGEDNLQYATVDGMPSWATFNLRTMLQLHPKINLLIGVENIADVNYRVFASGISSAGRNYIVGVKADF